MNSHNHNDNTEEDKDEDEFHDDIRSDNDTNNDDGDDDDDNDDDDDDASDSDEDDEDGEEEDDEETNTSDDDSISLGPVPLPDDVELEYTFPQDFQGRRWQAIVNGSQYFRLLIDPSCTDIPHGKFGDCMLLIEIVFLDGSTLINIGAASFRGCDNLQRMNKLPEGLKRIMDFAFEGCTSLVEVTVPSTVILLGEQCFAFCSSLRRVDFVEPATTTTAAIAVVELRPSVFVYCTELRSVRLPQNMASIPVSCFEGCCSLIDVPIPAAVRNIRSESFDGCTSLTSIDLSENIELIEREAYDNCTSLGRVTIRSSSLNLRIGENVFGGCSALSSMTVFPSVWSQLFYSMNDERHPNFIYQFLRDYHYQINRLIEWKKADGTVLVPSSSVSLIDATEDTDEGKRRRLR